MHDPRTVLQGLYGFAFPESFFAFHSFNMHLKELGIELGDVVGLSPSEAFEVFDAGLDLADYDPVEGSRYYCDPPEFFTIMDGFVDGLHWGFWVDDGTAPEYPVVGYHHSDAYELHICGDTLFEAIRAELESQEQGALENSEYINDEEEMAFEAESARQRQALREAMVGYPTGDRMEIGEDYLDRYGPQPRPVVALSFEGMGIVAPEALFRPVAGGDPFVDRMFRPVGSDFDRLFAEGVRALEDGFPATALKIGRDLWIFSDAEELSAELLLRAYEAMGRQVQLGIVRRFRHAAGAGELPEFIKALEDPEGTTSLSLMGKNVESVPPSIGALRALTSLGLANNRLSVLPEALSSLSALEYLSLQGNRFAAFPEVLFGLPSLRDLNLCDNPMTTIPDDPRGLPALEELVINGAQWTAFPEAIAAWPKLARLTMRYSVMVDAIPAAIGRMKALEVLEIQTKVALREVSAAMAEAEGLRHLHYACMLDGFDGIVTVPDNLFLAPNLTHLRLACNQRMVISEALGGLSGLEELVLECHQMEIVPEAVWSLGSLETLSLSGRLGTLPEDIGRLTALEELHCGACQLTTLPRSLETLPNLRHIHAAYNEFSNDEIARLRARFRHVELSL